ncbi:prenyltransferase/squalene oxidase repeat-containing protein [Actinocrispum wychmicini]|uniref:prenyltransferase/squalene oxidase repeat-containing protein n=1 Tax=Actinocrispum wychmicini TaxID=1213861 RepID=UPI001FB754E3|nr:prenyltransferase/squalene oxidase repeat-containing protein [Actinocrispum wychmicini]
MESSLRRRGAALAAALSVLVAGVAVTVQTGTAWASAERAAAKANSRWLAKQLAPDGTLNNPNGGDLPDHGLMIDTLFAMYASGDGKLAAPIVKYMDAHATDYYTWDGLLPGQGYDAIIVGGATAKVLVAAEMAGRDPRTFGGHDMVAETQGAIMRSGPDKGRVSDYAKKPEMADIVSNNANMFGQALGVIGLAAVGENDQLAIDKLLTQQCSEGYFRIFFGHVKTTETGDHVTPDGYKVSTCDEGKPFDQSGPDGDATGMALSALLAARKAGAANLDAPIDKTVAWLKAHQPAGGGWHGGVTTDAPNTNSTGLIVQALAEAGGADDAVRKGTAYLKASQASDADAGNALTNDIGAIAYTPEQYHSARTTGVTGLDTWIRAGAQASLGLSQVGFYDLAQGRVPPDEPTSQTPTPSQTPTGGSPSPEPSHEPTGSPPPANPPAAGTGTRPPPATRRGGTVVTPSTSPPDEPSVAATPPVPGPPAPATALGGYLAGKLVNGDHVEVTQDGRTFVDYDATADLLLALRTLGEQPEAVDRVSKFLLTPESVKAYAHGVPYEQADAAYAEPLAKLLIIARFQPPGPDDVIGQLANDLARLRTDSGEFVDTGGFADTSRSVQHQAWAILATGADPDVLIARQCKDGTFPSDLTKKDCDTGDLAATAIAVEALNSGRPDEWTKKHATALETAAGALQSTVDDPVLAARMTAARASVGLDVSETVRAVGALLLADGGMAKTEGAGSDLATSIAVAPGVAGRSWTQSPGSPVVAAVRLPLTRSGDDPRPVAQASVPSAPTLSWIALGFVLAAAVAVGGRVVLGLRKRTKGVAR